MQKQEAHQIPQRFIQKGGVDIGRLARNRVVQAHAQKAARFFPKGLPVKEIAPPADALADEKAQADQIQQGKYIQLLHPAVHQAAKDCPNNTAINGQAPLPDIQAGDGVGGILLPGEGAVIGPGAENCEGSHPQDPINDVIFPETELAAPAAGIQHRQTQPQGNHQAIPTDAEAAQGNPCGGI